MRGTIESLGRGSFLGRIRGDDGRSYPFESNDILAFDLKRLRIGLVVNFETRQNRAVHVSVEPYRLTPVEKEEDNPLRLRGFEQRGTVRVYPRVRPMLPDFGPCRPQPETELRRYVSL